MEHEIVRSVAAAQKDAQAADALVRQYLPFIKAETAKFLKRIPVEGQDDELGIAMFAFHEAAMAYQSGRGSFLKLAAAAIRNRLIDYQRMEQRHAGHISLDQTVDGDAEGRTLLETIDTGHDEIAHRQELGAAQEEIMKTARSRNGRWRPATACCPARGSILPIWSSSLQPESSPSPSCPPKAAWTARPWSGTGNIWWRCCWHLPTASKSSAVICGRWHAL